MFESARSGSARHPVRGRVAVPLVVAGVLVLILAWRWSGRESARAETVAAQQPESTGAEIERRPPSELEVADAAGAGRAPVPAAPESTPEEGAPSSAEPESPESIVEEHVEPTARESAIRELLPRSGLGPGGGGDPAQRLAKAKEVVARESASGETNLALRVLLELEPETGRAELFALLEGDDPLGQAAVAAATWAAARYDEALSSEDLAAIYELGDADTRIAAASVLEMRGDDNLIRRFEADCAADLESDDPAVRVEAVRGLSHCRSESTRALLTSLLTHEEEELRYQALRALSDGEPTDDLLAAIRPLQDDPSQRVARMAERFVQRAEAVRLRLPSFER